jgi:hypothetical protein
LSKIVLFDKPGYRQGDRPSRGARYVWPQRDDVRLEDFVNDAFARADNIHTAVLGENTFQDDIQNENDNLEVDVDDMEDLGDHSTTLGWLCY